MVSIHAPARGATVQKDKAKEAFMFQSTRPRGARHADEIWNVMDILFQSTRPRGARQWPRVPSATSPCFNPRARAGRDRARAGSGGISQVSIHAPARGATRACDQMDLQVCFNPRARAGRDS